MSHGGLGTREYYEECVARTVKRAARRRSSHAAITPPEVQNGAKVKSENAKKNPTPAPTTKAAPKSVKTRQTEIEVKLENVKKTPSTKAVPKSVKMRQTKIENFAKVKPEDPKKATKAAPKSVMMRHTEIENLAKAAPKSAKIRQPEIEIKSEIFEKTQTTKTTPKLVKTRQAEIENGAKVKPEDAKKVTKAAPKSVKTRQAEVENLAKAKSDHARKTPNMTAAESKSVQKIRQVCNDSWQI